MPAQRCHRPANARPPKPAPVIWQPVFSCFRRLRAACCLSRNGTLLASVFDVDEYRLSMNGRLILILRMITVIALFMLWQMWRERKKAQQQLAQEPAAEETPS